MIVADWNNLEQQTVSQWSSSHQISGMSFSCAHGCFKSLDLDRTSRPVRRCHAVNQGIKEAESASMAGRHGKSHVRFTADSCPTLKKTMAGIDDLAISKYITYHPGVDRIS